LKEQEPSGGSKAIRPGQAYLSMFTVNKDIATAVRSCLIISESTRTTGIERKVSFIRERIKWIRWKRELER